MSAVDDALKLAARGWPVLWLKPQSKEPATAHGVHDATVDADQIRAWAAAMPDGNIGIATGAPGPDVLDVDYADRAPDGLEARCVELGAPTVATARGHQYYFQGTTNRTIGLGFGELRRQDSYVLAPSSVHPTGKVYTWLSEPNGRLPTVPDGVVRLGKRAGEGDSEPREHIEPGSMYDYLLDRAVRLARAGERDADVIERALVAAFELKRVPDAAYGGNARDTRRLAEWAVKSEIADRERRRETGDSWLLPQRTRAEGPDTPATDRYAGRILNVPELLAQPDEDTLWRCDRLVADGFLTTLAGVHGEGKSWLALALACATGRGGTAAGLHCPAGRSAIFDAENGPRLMIRRFRMIGAADLPVSLVDVGGLHVLRDIDWLKQTVRDLGARFVVFDSLRMLSSGAKENDGDVMEPIMTALKLLARDTDAGVLLVHHRGKSEENDYRGTSVIGDQTDLMFRLERVKGDPDGATRRRLVCVKCRIDEEPEPRWLQISADRAAGTVSIMGADAYEPEEARPRDAHRDRVLAMLADAPLGARKVAEAVGISEPTARRVLHDLRDEDLAVSTAEGWVRHRVTPLGGDAPDAPQGGSTEPNQGVRHRVSTLGGDAPDAPPCEGDLTVEEALERFKARRNR
jgi:Bifunctional DNA primase/polymerase, N-terminal/AAA domain